MRTFQAASLAFVLCFAPAASAAVDWTKIDRAIVKEPVYQSKPKYCLLVFGPEAKTRVWLVVDGDTLYVDRNGNGDLTEPGKRVRTKGTEKYGLVFEVGDVQEGELLHKSLTVTVGDFGIWQSEIRDYPEYQRLLAKDPQPRSYAIRLEVAMPGWRGTAPEGRVVQAAGCFDAAGILQFADRPQDAPLVHFRGPWAMDIPYRQQFRVGDSTELFLSFGTKGLGPGTFVCVGYQGLVPEDAFPVLDIAFPPKKAGQPPVPSRCTLKARC
jgi:hypothetical protein